MADFNCWEPSCPSQPALYQHARWVRLVEDEGHCRSCWHLVSQKPSPIRGPRLQSHSGSHRPPSPCVQAAISCSFTQTWPAPIPVALCNLHPVSVTC